MILEAVYSFYFLFFYHLYIRYDVKPVMITSPIYVRILSYFDDIILRIITIIVFIDAYIEFPFVAGLLESPGMPHADSITVAQVLEEIRGQVATVYP